MPPKPVVLAVDDEPHELGRIQTELLSRYRRHYEIICTTSSDEGMRVLRELVAAGRDVALTLIDQWMPETTGVEFLAKVKAVDPRIKRTLLVPWGGWGDPATADAIVRAMTLGLIDYYLLKPWQSPDELFHKTVSAFLHDWMRSQPPLSPQITIVGRESEPRSQELRTLLSRYRVDHAFLSPESDAGRDVLKRAQPAQDVLPLVALLDGRVLINPSDVQLARALGLSTQLGEDKAFDVVVIGAGPAGLAAAVYGSSEGLDTLVVERHAIGGQAGSSPLIRNYLGFARGVSGSELAQQAYQQAWVFGTRFALMREAKSLRREREQLVVTVSDGEEVTSRTVVLTMGVSYRRLGIERLDELVGAGVFYGAPTTEAQALQGRDVVVVGGGNSAGEAAMHLSAYASSVTILVRGESLAESMSDYLIQEIQAAPNVRVRQRTQVVDGGGNGRLERVVVSDAEGRRQEEIGCAALFVLIGAKPYTQWLPDDIQRDRWGFLQTGRDFSQKRLGAQREPLLLETSMPGVFAAGDVRHGSVKRVASAVGEGSVAIGLVHEYLQDLARVNSASTPRSQ